MLYFLHNVTPSAAETKLILFICSCTWDHTLPVDNWLQAQFPQAHITYVLRDRYPESFRGRDVHVSTAATSLSGKRRLISSLREQFYDIIVICWTNEDSFVPLKTLPFFLRGRSCIVFNENHDCFWLTRKNLKVLIGHAKWRFLERAKATSTARSLISLLSLIFLLPLGMLYVVIRVVYYSMKKRFPLRLGGIRGLW